MTPSCHHESSSFPTTPVLLTTTVSSTTTVVFTVTETAYQTATTTPPASASQPNTVRFARARQPFINSDDHESHEHSSPPVNPATSVIKQKPKGIDLTTNTKYFKHHSRVQAQNPLEPDLQNPHHRSCLPTPRALLASLLAHHWR
ncbi:hypothetical protein E4U09_001718 [Claviceps aff. purpurea]|uniref:Uncharacterized protein n=1 Tax=Claviceps aff. purpurea TaxID=1967640 RepID=A0A9P7U1M1_9HYPO|nr:hypothetical protein E4U09_001718 [Claviceps aff. purpurea]